MIGSSKVCEVGSWQSGMGDESIGKYWTGSHGKTGWKLIWRG